MIDFKSSFNTLIHASSNRCSLIPEKTGVTINCVLVLFIFIDEYNFEEFAEIAKSLVKNPDTNDQEKLYFIKNSIEAMEHQLHEIFVTNETKVGFM